MTYIAGLKAARALCQERVMKLARGAKTWEAESDQRATTHEVLEAHGCAQAIERLIEEAEREDTKAEGDETYLRDGVYASFDGWQIWLRMTREDGRDRRFAVDPLMFSALLTFAARQFWTPPESEDAP